MDMDKAKKTRDIYSQIEKIDERLEKEDYMGWVEFYQCLRVLQEVSEKDYKTATNFIFESLQENKERLEREVYNL